MIRWSLLGMMVQLATLPLAAQVWTMSYLPPSPNGQPLTGGAANTDYVFTFQFTHPAGSQSLNVVDVLMNKELNSTGSCYFAYDQTNLSFQTDNTDASGNLIWVNWGPGQTVSNSKCAISAFVASNIGQTLTLTMNIRFTPAAGATDGFQHTSGDKVIYLAARDLAGLNTGWQASGQWIVPPSTPQNNTAQRVLSITPPRATAQSVQYSIVVEDSNNTNGPGVVNVLINNFLDGRGACYLAFVPTTLNSSAPIYLVSEPDASGNQSLIPLTGNSVSNGQCTVFSSGTNARNNPNNTRQRYINLNVQFNSNWIGGKIVYVAAREMSDSSNSGWQPMATWMQAGGGALVVTRAVSVIGRGSKQQIFARYESPFGPNDISTGELALSPSGANYSNSCQLEWTSASGITLKSPTESGIEVQSGSIGQAISITKCSVSAGASLTPTSSGFDLRLGLNLTTPLMAGPWGKPFYISTGGRNRAGVENPLTVLSNRAEDPVPEPTGGNYNTLFLYNHSVEYNYAHYCWGCRLYSLDLEGSHPSILVTVHSHVGAPLTSAADVETVPFEMVAESTASPGSYSLLANLYIIRDNQTHPGTPTSFSGQVRYPVRVIGEDTTPIIYSITPSTFMRGTISVPVIITGSGFGTNASIEIDGNGVFSHSSGTPSTDNQISAIFDIDPEADSTVNVSVIANGTSTHNFAPAPGASQKGASKPVSTIPYRAFNRANWVRSPTMCILGTTEGLPLIGKDLWVRGDTRDFSWKPVTPLGFPPSEPYRVYEAITLNPVNPADGGGWSTQWGAFQGTSRMYDELSLTADRTNRDPAGTGLIIDNKIADVEGICVGGKQLVQKGIGVPVAVPLVTTVNPDGSVSVQFSGTARDPNIFTSRLGKLSPPTEEPRRLPVPTRVFLPTKYTQMEAKSFGNMGQTMEREPSPSQRQAWPIMIGFY